MENQEYVFEEKAEKAGDEIIIGDVEFKLETNKGNTSFGKIVLQHSSCIGYYWLFCAVSIYPTALCHPDYVTSVRLSRLISGGCICTLRIYP